MTKLDVDPYLDMPINTPIKHLRKQEPDRDHL